ncbi:hypothetical protein D5018_08470 [Parashewanella curva]|uniref:Uncharacterized protein n=1 Tax=Parashewanella curva TaxID=2338552 RepID=A0A3L8Q041_9GAMM|nr:hypothetical protein [Parashewanella curva]RLV60158.1 hypothetical protein D5018_08470 [Parashewanella curva]
MSCLKPVIDYFWSGSLSNQLRNEYLHQVRTNGKQNTHSKFIHENDSYYIEEVSIFSPKDKGRVVYKVAGPFKAESTSGGLTFQRIFLFHHIGDNYGTLKERFAENQINDPKHVNIRAKLEQIVNDESNYTVASSIDLVRQGVEFKRFHEQRKSEASPTVYFLQACNPLETNNSRSQDRNTPQPVETQQRIATATERAIEDGFSVIDVSYRAARSNSPRVRLSPLNCEQTGEPNAQLQTQPLPTTEELLATYPAQSTNIFSMGFGYLKRKWNS